MSCAAPPSAMSRPTSLPTPESSTEIASKDGSETLADTGDRTQTPSALPTAATVKQKQSSATSAAGRKKARQTAHSLIERRRRSKMNEAFGVLQTMVPACTGEMHKLAILQASIEYVRYMERCMETLQKQRINEQQKREQQQQYGCDNGLTERHSLPFVPTATIHGGQQAPPVHHGVQKQGDHVNQEATAALLMLNSDRRGVGRSTDGGHYASVAEIDMRTR